MLAGVSKTLLRDSSVSMAVRAAGLATGFVSHIVLSRLLGLAGYGQYVILMSWALLLVLPARLGLDNVALRFASQYRGKDQPEKIAGLQRFAIGRIVLASIAFSALAAAVFVLFRQPFLSDGWALLSLPMLVLPMAVIGFLSAMFRSSGRFVAAQFYEQLFRPAALIAFLALAAVVWSGGAALGVWATVASLWFVLILMVGHSNRIDPLFGAKTCAEDRQQWHAVSVGTLGAMVIYEALNQSDLIMLGWFGTAEQAGLFSAAWRLASLVPFGLVAVGTVAASSIAQADKNGDRAELARVARDGARLSFAFGLAIAAVILLCAPIVFRLFGSGFGAAQAPLFILVLAGVFNAATGIVTYLMLMTGRQKDLALLVGVALVVDVVLNAMLIPRYGATGAAVSAAAASILWNGAAAIRIWQVLRIDATVLGRSAT